MDTEPTERSSNPWAMNPLFALWTLPFIMTQTWMTAMLGVTRPRDDAHREAAEGQIPVPPVFQERTDRELFA